MTAKAKPMTEQNEGLREQVIGALARGYCTERNKKKVLDPDLIFDMADAILALIPKPMSEEEISAIIEKLPSINFLKGYVVKTTLSIDNLIIEIAHALAGHIQKPAIHCGCGNILSNKWGFYCKKCGGIIEETPLPPKQEKIEEQCNCCGGEQVWIRGRYPKQEKRLVCPTCCKERLEQINEMSDEGYGKCYTSNQKQPSKQ